MPRGRLWPVRGRLWPVRARFPLVSNAPWDHWVLPSPPTLGTPLPGTLLLHALVLHATASGQRVADVRQNGN